MAMIQAVHSRNPIMRNPSRMQRVSIGGIHEQYLNGDFEFAREAET